MSSLIIEGAVPLNGTIRVSGAKNAALPLLFASILFEDTVLYDNVPDLMDIHTTVKLLQTLGFEVDFENNAMQVHPTDKISHEAPYDLVKTMRASVLCLGPLLARLGKASVAMPGGCAIGARPVDLHLSALEKMGATFTFDGGYIKGECKGRKLHGAHIHFDFPTVGGTQNIIMAACIAQGQTILENAACEPEVVDLIRFLNSCGANIEGEGQSTLKIQGSSLLKSFSPYSVMSDRIEAGTYLIAAGMTDGEIRVENCPHAQMESFCTKLEEVGISLTIEDRTDTVIAKRHFEKIKAADLTTRPHPGFPTDMQAQMMAMLCLADGPSIIEETIFENRFMHVPELVRLGADIRLSGNKAIVRGVKDFLGAPVMASDLRAAAALVIAALSAKGTSTIERIYHLDRGYEGMEIKLEKLGAKIRRINGNAL